MSEADPDTPVRRDIDPEENQEPSNNDAMNYEPAEDEWGFADPNDFYDP